MFLSFKRSWLTCWKKPHLSCGGDTVELHWPATSPHHRDLGSGTQAAAFAWAVPPHRRKTPGPRKCPGIPDHDLHAIFTEEAIAHVSATAFIKTVELWFIVKHYCHSHHYWLPFFIVLTQILYSLCFLKIFPFYILELHGCQCRWTGL